MPVPVPRALAATQFLPPLASMSADPFHPLASGETALFYRTAIGVRGQNYHLPRFLRFDEKGQTGLSWNWMASLFTLNWLIYRKLWGLALAYVGALGLAVLLVFGVGKLVFDYSSALAWLLGLWIVSAAYIVPGLYANVWLYNHYNDKISEVLRTSSGVTDTISKLTAVAPGDQRLLRQLLANVLVLAVLLVPVLTLYDGQVLGGDNAAQLADAADREAAPQAAAPRTEPPAAPQAASGPVAAGRVSEAPNAASSSPAVPIAPVAASAPTTPPVPSPVAAPAPVSSPVAANPPKAVDDAATRPVVAFEPAFNPPSRGGSSGGDMLPVASFAANPVAPAPLNEPLPTPFSPRTNAGPTDLVPLQSVPLSPSRVQAPAAQAPVPAQPRPQRPTRVAQAEPAPQAPSSASTRTGNVASGVVTQAPVTPAPAPAPTVSAYAPVPAATPPAAPATAPRRVSSAPAESEKPQPSARLRAASQAAQAKRAAQAQGQSSASPAAASVARAPVSNPARSAATPSWVVQAGVFRQANNAHRVAAQLQAMGIDAVLEEFPNNKGEPMLRVVAGPYALQSQAQQAAQRIQARSLPAMVMRETR
jgi:cell division septation protein DedD